MKLPLANLPENFDDFRQAWIEDIIHGKQTSVEKGRVFALKIIHQWLNLDAENDEENENLFYCDGSGDGGIDVAYLQRGDEDTPGDTWYLVQSKYGEAFQGPPTLLSEGIKVIETLEGERTQLSSLAQDVVDRLDNFRLNMGANDRIVLVFANIDPLSPDEKKMLDNVRSIGKARLSFDFGVESISLRTIFDRLSEERAEGVRVPLSFDIPTPDQKTELLVGTVPLPAIYDFLRAFKQQRSDLQLLYAKNVRQYLSATRINKKIIETLNNSPKLFGFYNNGITIVVSEYLHQNGMLELVNPSVVNGCQTTRSIYDVFDKKLNSGGTDKSKELAQWQLDAADGMVIVKIVRVGEQGEELLENIVRFTNSQNSVKDQDFLALEDKFKKWQKQMASKEIYLEIQRGGSDAQKARQKSNPSMQQFSKDEFANAFELLKVYGAGWLGEPGPAWGKNKAFSPDGDAYNRIIDSDFGADDFMECFYLQRAANEYGFGKSGAGSVQTRRVTRALFYFVVLELVRQLLNQNKFPDDHQSCTHALRLLRESGEQKIVFEAALQVIDKYMNPKIANSFQEEPEFETRFGGNLNNYLKHDQVGKSKMVSPKLWHWIQMLAVILGMPTSDGQTSGADQITATWNKELRPVE